MYGLFCINYKGPLFAFKNDFREKQRVMRTVVCKFGGSSLADAGQFRKVKAIVNEDPDRRIVIASAPGKRFDGDIKVTDLLQHCFDLAVSGNSFEETLHQISERFNGIINELGIDFSLSDDIRELKEHLSGSPKKDYVLSRGEYLNSRILAEYLGFAFVDPKWCVCFDQNGKLDSAITRRTLGAALQPLTHAVIAGFYGADMNGEIRTFSRGGSDLTGSLAASAVQADLYENWTDVSGLMSADPRIVTDPKSVKYVSYRELRTLSYMGASVLHTDAVLPVSDKGIPINIRNTNDPSAAGTMIVRKLPKGEIKHPIIGVAGLSGMSVIQVEKLMVSDESGFTAIMLDILKNRQLPFEQCLTGIDTVTLVIKTELLDPCKEELFAEIRERLDPDYLGLTEDLSMIAVIGEKGTDDSNANVRVLTALTKKGIPINTINQGAGKLNLLIGVPKDRYEEAIVTIYQEINRYLEKEAE